MKVIKAGRLTTAASMPLSLTQPIILASLRPDVVHVHSPYPLGEAANYLLGRARATVITHHSDVVRQQGWLRLYGPLLRRMLCTADRIIATSPRYIETSPWLRPVRDQCVVVPLGVEVDRFAGERVRALDNFSTGRRENVASFLEDIELIEGDLCHLDTVRQATKGVDYILHQGALPSVLKSIDNPLDTDEANVRGTLNLLVAARDAGVKRVVYVSSSSVYGDTPTLPKTEEMKPAPLSPYAVSKLAGEHYCQVFYQVYGLEPVALRYFNVFGPRQDPNSQHAAADLFVLPTLHDPWGLAVNEAMAFGLPIIVTDAAGCARDLVQDNGLLVPAGDVDALATALARLLPDEALRRAMGQRSRRIISAYTVGAACDAFLQVINHMLERPRFSS